MLVVGNTDAHLKNWALTYPDRRTATLSPIYDFHSLTVYTRYQYGALALSLSGEVTASAIYLDSFRRLAEHLLAIGEDAAFLIGRSVTVQAAVHRHVDRMAEWGARDGQSIANFMRTVA